LVAARAVGRGRLVCVFGCGGDRDAGKRPEMGAVVGRLATRAIVTNDNPRTEEPGRIAKAIVKGLKGAAADFEVVLDRSAAINAAIADAQPGDVVVIAGKGHESYQLIENQTLAFDDREQARLALDLRRKAQS